jgi:predicted alpha/beta-fold hydrolase
MVAALQSAGYKPVFMYLRGRSGEPNRLPRTYHSGASEDIAAVLAQLAEDEAEPVLAAIGYSLGGNMLLKYLGERESPLVKAGVAVSVPFVLRDAMLRLNLGFSRIYQRHLLRRLKETYREKFARIPSPIAVDLRAIRDFYEYDDKVTAHLNGFSGAEEYYARCSCRPYLARITRTTLILHSADDPFMFPRTTPLPSELGPGVTLELAQRGGHVGFVAGHLPWRPRYWLEDRIVEFLGQVASSNGSMTDAPPVSPVE